MKHHHDQISGFLAPLIRTCNLPARNARRWIRFRLLDRSGADVFPWRYVEGRQLRDIIDSLEVLSRVFGKIGRYRRVNITALHAPNGQDVLRCHFRRPRGVCTRTEYVCLIRFFLRTRGGDGLLLVRLKIDHRMSVINILPLRSCPMCVWVPNFTYVVSESDVISSSTGERSLSW